MGLKLSSQITSLTKKASTEASINTHTSFTSISHFLQIVSTAPCRFCVDKTMCHHTIALHTCLRRALKSCPRRLVASVWTKHSVTTLLPSIRVYVGPSLSIVCKSCPRRRRASVWTKHSAATLLPIIRVYVGPLYYYLPYVST